ncbi:hypothetical protein K435DRAFT_799980 [Dendrothele bispora CBS 962.96]|uniref:Uncharacterized protein n=1 Tax=Dendrothele bispora (strain CBS 962.96) TaxID=1314807 RepID=A0A4S8LU79_DENBC|nr:hypothetical protein K435DRAFT_799980 [Dendrothele bispora CBS 962.96]
MIASTYIQNQQRQALTPPCNLSNLGTVDDLGIWISRGTEEVEDAAVGENLEKGERDGGCRGNLEKWVRRAQETEEWIKIEHQAMLDAKLRAEKCQKMNDANGKQRRRMQTRPLSQLRGCKWFWLRRRERMNKRAWICERFYTRLTSL